MPVKQNSWNLTILKEEITIALIDINNYILGQVYATKFLGQWIHDKLECSTNVQNLHIYLRMSLQALRILTNPTSFETALCAYFANVHSHIRY